ncbi:MAG: DUF5724 domain-containing protein [Phycisphaerae bacterium]|nr:DUF5724 domain-containing protein [Phycisphaerae bacterium]
MLDYEFAQKLMASQRDAKSWMETRLESLKPLSPELREAGHALIGCPRGKIETELRDRPVGSRVLGKRRLRDFDDADLLALGKALFPKFPAVFEAGWRQFEHLPYQHGYERKPFRASTRPDVLRPVRVDFLENLLVALDGFDQDISWIAAHAAHLNAWQSGLSLGVLLAAAIDMGTVESAAVEQILRESAEGLHPVGQMGQHVVAAMLATRKRECWEYMAKLLLAAQRQEGLRQAILEYADFGHPEAFRLLLRTIVDHSMERFSATVRAFNVWLGLPLDAQSQKYVRDTLGSLAGFLDEPAARRKALDGDDAEKAYFALWAAAFDDAPAAVGPAERLLKHGKPEFRYAALKMLGMIDLPEGRGAIVREIDDEDLRVAVSAAELADAHLQKEIWRLKEVRREEEQARQRAAGETVSYGGGYGFTEPPASGPDHFDRLSRLFERIPAKAKKPKPLIWPWVEVTPERRDVADAMISALGDRPCAALLPVLDAMSPRGRQWVAFLFGGQGAKLDGPMRAALLRLVGDASGTVREEAVTAMGRIKISPADLPMLEPLLTRKAADLRRGVLGLLLKLADSDLLASVERLLAAKNAAQRLAGLDLLQQMHASKRSVEAVRTAAEGYRAARETLERDEQVYLDNILAEPRETPTLANALGLMDPAKRTPPPQLRKRDVVLCTPAARKLLELLDAKVHEHRDEPIEFQWYGGEVQQVALGAIDNHFAYAFKMKRKTFEFEREPAECLPLREVWAAFWTSLPKAAEDKDGLSAARAVLLAGMYDKHKTGSRGPWSTEFVRQLFGERPPLRYPSVVRRVIEWHLLEQERASANLADFATDALETVLAHIPSDRIGVRESDCELAFRRVASHVDSSAPLEAIARLRGDWTPEHTRQMFALNRWLDEPVWPEHHVMIQATATKAPDTAVSEPQRVPIGRKRMYHKHLIAAFEACWANEHDLLDELLGERELTTWNVADWFDCLSDLAATVRRAEKPTPIVQVVRRAIDRILEIELARGEAETVATPAALALCYSGGLDVLVRVLEAIGRDPKLQRNRIWADSSKGKASVFSHLLRVTMPGAADTPAEFVRRVRAAKIGEDALLAVAFYAPQWAGFVEAALGWKLFAEAVWWFHAHTKDNQWRVDQEIRESWNAEIRKLTPLTLEDLVEGAVDVDWFQRVYAAIGEKRWSRLDQFAKYASGGVGHKRAQLFADAMLGKLKKAELLAAIRDKRKQDAVRALGLQPLEKPHKSDVLQRYKVMQEFVRTARQFGSQRQASEKLAARIGQENLARTAGYPDPVRLQWAMEALATADLAKGPVVAKVGAVAVQLAIDADGLPEISVARGEKSLKSIPADVKKNEAVQELVERKTELRRSASRMRQSLELAMCRGDRFSAEELRELMGNVLLRPMLERLVFVGEGVLGYPVEGGKALRDQGGKLEPVKKGESLRLAHPVDLLAGKAWDRWQRDCMAAERVQPFKQLFRELYVLTPQERSDKTFSRRYAGQQVNPRQALALLGGRGWVTAPEAGVFRTDHDEKIEAWIEFMEGFYTPAEVEGLTLEKVRFARRGATEYLDLASVPPRLLSETMRDVDLIVSVAHRGGVDPEASASTVEMRTSLLRDTLQLLKLDNVKLKGPHAIIRGVHAEYSVHLGSATTHMLPGGALFIVPVHSQHRGRIFLPFADEDPKTAEVLSKVLLLARDQEIKDPGILDQIRMRR